MERRELTRSPAGPPQPAEPSPLLTPFLEHGKSCFCIHLHKGAKAQDEAVKKGSQGKTEAPSGDRGETPFVTHRRLYCLQVFPEHVFRYYCIIITKTDFEVQSASQAPEQFHIQIWGAGPLCPQGLLPVTLCLSHPQSASRSPTLSPKHVGPTPRFTVRWTQTLCRPLPPAGSSREGPCPLKPLFSHLENVLIVLASDSL